MTRPEIPINWEKVDELLMSGSPGTEIAAFFGMHEETFYNRVEKKFNTGFSVYAAEKRATGEAMLRLHQYQKAVGLTKKGDNTLLIFLGKQRLGQRDNPQEKTVSEDVMKAFELLMGQIQEAQDMKKEAAYVATDAQESQIQQAVSAPPNGGSVFQ